MIFGLFLIGLLLTLFRVLSLTRELNNISVSSTAQEYIQLQQKRGHEVAVQSMQIKLFAKVQWIQRLAASLVALGLIGTVYGAITFLLGVDVAALGDVAQIGSAFAVVLDGMGIALYTTLVGGVLNLWLTFNYGIVETGTATLIAAVLDGQ